MTWKRQEKILRHEDIPTREEMINIIKKIENPKWRAFVSLLYSTGCRITEALSFQKKDAVVLYKKDRKGNLVKLYLITLLNEKHKRRKIKKIPLRFDKELFFIKQIASYLEDFDDEEAPFYCNRHYAWRKVVKLTGFNPHWIRHIRLTHLMSEYDFTEQKLMKWAGWSDTRQSERYVEFSVRDLMEY